MTEEIRKTIGQVKSIILVLSGKGGVGKSTVAAQIALQIASNGNKVGILDIDLCGPSIPQMFGLDKQDVQQCSNGWIPVYTDADPKIAVMSLGFLLQSKSDAVVWRGPRKNAMIQQFLTDVIWGELDYLIVDTPPGTSDEHITVIENIRKLHVSGAVLVTTSQAVAVGDVRREITFCKKAGISVIGIIENMSGYVCPNCSECSNIFSKGGGEALAKETQIPFLGKCKRCLPLDPRLTLCGEEGKHFSNLYPSSGTAVAIRDIVQKLQQ